MAVGPSFINREPVDSICQTGSQLTEEALTEEMQTKGIKDEVGPFWKQYRCIFGFIAQMSYV